MSKKTPSTIIHKNIEFLQQLSNAQKSKKECNLILSKANNEELLVIVEICWNLLRSRLPINKQQKKKLLKYAPLVRKISRIRSEKSAKKTFNQTGRGIPLIASLVANLVLPLLGEAAISLIRK